MFTQASLDSAPILAPHWGRNNLRVAVRPLSHPCEPAGPEPLIGAMADPRIGNSGVFRPSAEQRRGLPFFAIPAAYRRHLSQLLAGWSRDDDLVKPVDVDERLAGETILTVFFVRLAVLLPPPN